MISEDAAAYRVMAVGKLPSSKQSWSARQTLEKSQADNGAAVSQNTMKARILSFLRIFLKKTLPCKTSRTGTRRSRALALLQTRCQSKKPGCREHEERTRVAVWEAVENTRVALSAKSTEEWNNMLALRRNEKLRSKMGVKLKDEAEKSFAKVALRVSRRHQNASVEKSLLMKHARARRAGEEASSLARKKIEAHVSTQIKNRAYCSAQLFCQRPSKRTGSQKSCAHACEQAKRS